MGGLFSSPKAPSVEPAEKINLAGPTGSSTFGEFDAQGNFIPAQGVQTQLTQESPFQEQFRTGQEGLSTALLQQLGGGQPLPSNEAFSVANIRGRVPNASQIGQGLQDFRMPEQAQAGLTAGGGDVSGLTQALTPLSQDFSGDASRVEQATFDRAQNLLGSDMEDQRNRLAQDLANKGIDPTSKAGQDELNRLERSQQLQSENLALSSVGAGRAEQDRLARLGLAQRGQQFGEGSTQFQLGEGQRGARLAEGLGLAQLGGQQRGQQFGEQASTLQAVLNKQLSLANLQAQQRAQAFGEVGSLSGLASPFQPQSINAVGGTALGATPAGPGFQLAGKLGGAFLGTL